MRDNRIVVDPLTVACESGLWSCGAKPGEFCDFGEGMEHMRPNSHWSRRDVAEAVQKALRAGALRAGRPTIVYWAELEAELEQV